MMRTVGPTALLLTGLILGLVCLFGVTSGHTLDPHLIDLGSGEKDIGNQDVSLEEPGYDSWEDNGNFLDKLSDDVKEKRLAFSAWNGKRDALDESSKRAAFSAWAGKRGFEGYKRAPFSAWAGKRALDDLESKRAAFNAWAGKRSSSDLAMNKKGVKSFSAWAGKRDSQNEYDLSDDLDGQSDKRAFSSWAGKRSIPEFKQQLRMLHWYLSQALAKVTEKRKFSAWAGKRTPVVYRRKFLPWSG